jgi:hypothetical protein
VGVVAVLGQDGHRFGDRCGSPVIERCGLHGSVVTAPRPCLPSALSERTPRLRSVDERGVSSTVRRQPDP